MSISAASVRVKTTPQFKSMAMAVLPSELHELIHDEVSKLGDILRGHRRTFTAREVLAAKTTTSATQALFHEAQMQVDLERVITEWDRLSE